MTELWIDGTAAVLPDDFNAVIKRENPFFTKNGEYSYDITLQLTNPTNAKLYEHLNRLNSVSELKTKRNTVLIADNRVYCNGTEIVTGWTEKSVSIQVTSGNSELNYFVGSELKISALKMPETNPLVNSFPDQQYIRKLYPEINFCLASVINRTSGKKINEWVGSGLSDNEDFVQHVPGFGEYDYIPQPFLCAYIREVLKALGYNLVQNDLENTFWKDLFICHVERTFKWSEMLPGWSVKEFLEEVELLFNCCFHINSKSKEAKLLFHNRFFEQSKTVHIHPVIDEYEAECEDDPDEDIQHSDIAYTFPKNAYFNHRCIPDSVYDTFPKKTIPAGISVSDFFLQEENQLTDVLFITEETGREYIWCHSEENPNAFQIKMVNEFRKIKRENATSALEIEMMPVEITKSTFRVYYEDSSFNHYFSYRHMIPVIDGQREQTEEEAKEDIDDILNGNLSEDNEGSKNPIFLAFHRGINSKEAVPPFDVPFPAAFTDEFIQSNQTINRDGATLRLQKLKEYLYDGAYEIDRKHGIKITSHDPNLVDTRCIFEIRNKRYVCKEIEYVLTASGRKKAWTGTFFPIKISDTEAEKRWILTDGKWRDGGVWLDNGRWLDE